MVEEHPKKEQTEHAKGDKITVKRADLEAHRRKLSRLRRHIETATVWLDELEQEYDRLTERTAG